MSNTWPVGRRTALSQDRHERWSANNWPGTRQLCCACDQPTGRCEEDSIYLPPKDPNGSDLGPLCEACFEERWPQDPPAPTKEPQV